MKLRKLRNRIAVASSLAAAAFSVALLVGGGVASAAPPYPTVGTYPQWLTTDNSVSHIIRTDGSDTTFFMQQTLSDLYTAAGLNGCPLASGQTNCAGTTVDTSDTSDNWDSTEILTGDNDVGSGNGQQQLCGALGTPDAVDIARSSKPIASNAGCTNANTLVETGYAKDEVTAVTWNSIDPAAVGVANGYKAFGTGLNPQTGMAFPSSGLIGNPAQGWLPGDPTNCTAGGSPACSGTAFTDIDGSQVGGVAGENTPIYRLWCQTSLTASGGVLPRITDWGQLTNLSAANNGGTAQTVGNGAPIGVPIRIIGVNPGSGTVATWYSFAEEGEASGPCNAKPFNPNAASGANPLTGDGDPASPINHEIALENNASQVGQFAQANWPNDAADQAVDIATSLYFISNGVYSTNTNAPVAQLAAGSGPAVPPGVPSAYASAQLNSNNTSGGPGFIPQMRSNTFPTARTLFNIYRNDNVKAAAGGYINWQCGDPTDGFTPYGLNNIDGNNFATDINSTIDGTYGFSQLTDKTPENATITPADGVAAPNATCAAQMTMTESGTTLTLVAAPAGPYSTIPTSVQPGWSVTGPGIPAGDTIASGGVGSTTLTLSHASTGSGSQTITFPGHPPVLAVENGTD